MILVSEINLAAGTYLKVMQLENLRNFIFQYRLLAGVNNSVEIQFWGTVYADADNETDNDWVNITEFLTGSRQVIVNDDNIHDMSLLDTNCTFAKIKVKYIVTAVTPNNIVKIGWSTKF